MLPGIVSNFGGKGLLIVDPYVHTHILPGIDLGEDPSKFVTEVFQGECTEAEIQRLVKSGQESRCDCVIGLGGGKTMDTAKAVSAHLKVPIVIAATSASTDAPTSARAVIYNEKGEVLSYLDLPRNPDVVLLDTEIIVKAPVRLLISGMGDALSTYFEAESCRKKCAPSSNCGAGHEHPGTLTVRKRDSLAISLFAFVQPMPNLTFYIYLEIGVRDCRDLLQDFARIWGSGIGIRPCRCRHTRIGTRRRSEYITERRGL